MSPRPLTQIKHFTDGLVVRWVTTSESPLLYVFDFWATSEHAAIRYHFFVLVLFWMLQFQMLASYFSPGFFFHDTTSYNHPE
jgi:hypothetical protein